MGRKLRIQIFFYLLLFRIKKLSDFLSEICTIIKYVDSVCCGTSTHSASMTTCTVVQLNRNK